MKKSIKHYGSGLKNCFNLKGYISNKDFILFTFFNAIIMKALSSFMIGFYNGYTGGVSNLNFPLFCVLFFMTTIIVIIKKIKTFRYELNAK